MATATDIGDRAKTADFVVRSITTAVLALALVGAVVVAVLLRIDIAPEAYALLAGFAGSAIGYYFGNHSAQNGSLIQSTAARRDGDTVRAQIAQEAALLAATTQAKGDEAK